jgi:hypothetical protein
VKKYSKFANKHSSRSIYIHILSIHRRLLFLYTLFCCTLTFSRLIKILRYSKFCLFQRISPIGQASSISSLLFVSIAVHFLTKTKQFHTSSVTRILDVNIKSTKLTFLNLFKRINFYTIINLLSYNFKWHTNSVFSSHLICCSINRLTVIANIHLLKYSSI